MNKKLSLVICTYNRADIIIHCLNSIKIGNINKNDIELIVIDNNSTDDTKALINNLNHELNIIYYFEPIKGTSQAKNTAFRISKGEWIGFLDSDILAPDNFIEIILNEIEYDIDIIGCRIVPEFFYRPKPRWLREEFESNIINGVGEVWAGAMFLKKTILPDPPFSVELGMEGNKLGYGEETELVNNLVKKGHKVSFRDDLKFRHIINQKKYKMSWHWKSHMAKGMTDSILGNYKKSSTLEIFFRLMETLFLYPLSLLKRTIFDRNYYLETLFNDWICKLFYYGGVLQGKSK